MSTATLIEARLAIVRKDLDEAMSRLSDADLSWAPSEGMRTIGGQLLEIAGTERQLIGYLRDSRIIPFEEATAFGEKSETLGGLKEILENVRGETLEYVHSLGETAMAAPVTLPQGWWEGLDLPEVPRGEALRGIAHHEWYHTGQLVSYLWSRGDDPYSWKTQ